MSFLKRIASKRSRNSKAKVSPTSAFDEENSDDKLSLTHASWLLQKASRLFANRKLALLLISHILATLVIFGKTFSICFFIELASEFHFQHSSSFPLLRSLRNDEIFCSK